MIKVDSKVFDTKKDIYILELSNNIKLAVSKEDYESYKIGDNYLGSLNVMGYAIMKGNDFLSDYITTTDFNQPHNIDYGSDPYIFKTKQEAYKLIELMEKQHNKGTFKVVEYRGYYKWRE